MTEEQIKALCRFMIENGKRKFSDFEKELLNQAVDQSRNWQELILTMMMASKQ